MLPTDCGIVSANKHIEYHVRRRANHRFGVTITTQPVRFYLSA
jgi:hypothetical protein